MRHFQRAALQPPISTPAWHALTWAAENLDPERDFVANLYGTAGAYLPAVAGVGITHMHAHIADQSAAAEAQSRTRTPSHVFWIERDDIHSPIGQAQYDRHATELRTLIGERSGEPVFAAPGVRVYRLWSSERGPPATPLSP